MELSVSPGGTLLIRPVSSLSLLCLLLLHVQRVWSAALADSTLAMSTSKGVRGKKKSKESLHDDENQSVISDQTSESGERRLIKRDDFICSSGHHAHLKEDFLVDQSALVGRKMQSPNTIEEENGSETHSDGARSRLSHVSTDTDLQLSRGPSMRRQGSRRSYSGSFIMTSPTSRDNDLFDKEELQFVVGGSSRTPTDEEGVTRPPLARRDSIQRPLQMDPDAMLHRKSSVVPRHSVTHPRQGESTDGEERVVKRDEIIHPSALAASHNHSHSEVRPNSTLPRTHLPGPLLENGRFDNPWPTWRKPSVSNIIKWSLTARDNSNIPTLEILEKMLPVVKPDSAVLRSGPVKGIRVTWMGHATTLFQMDGVTILTDPIFSDRASPFQFIGPKRYREAPCTVHELPKVDAVVISHNHYDHLDLNTVQLLNARFGNDLRWFVPLGMGKWMNKSGPENVVEMSWWEEDRLANRSDIRIIFTPTQHWSKRTHSDEYKSLWGSWVVIGPHYRFYFAGDTGYCEAFKIIGERYGPFNLAAIPIGAYEPRWFMGPQHVDPEEAVKIHLDVRAERSLGIHWGTFSLANEYYLEPPVKLKEALEARRLTTDEFFVLKHGESKLVGV